MNGYLRYDPIYRATDAPSSHLCATNFSSIRIKQEAVRTALWLPSTSCPTTPRRLSPCRQRRRSPRNNARRLSVGCCTTRRAGSRGVRIKNPTRVIAFGVELLWRYVRTGGVEMAQSFFVCRFSDMANWRIRLQMQIFSSSASSSLAVSARILNPLQVPFSSSRILVPDCL